MFERLKWCLITQVNITLWGEWLSYTSLSYEENSVFCERLFNLSGNFCCFIRVLFSSHTFFITLLSNKTEKNQIFTNTLLCKQKTTSLLHSGFLKARRKLLTRDENVWLNKFDFCQVCPFFHLKIEKFATKKLKLVYVDIFHVGLAVIYKSFWFCKAYKTKTNVKSSTHQ